MLFETPAQADERFMRIAIEEARDAAKAGEVPIGAVIVVNGRIIARSHNLTETLRDVSAHAEMLAITSAAQNVDGKYLPDCTIYVTVEPCTMCAGALGWAQIGRIVYGAPDTKRGFFSVYKGARSPIHPRTIITAGVLEKECSTLLTEFFRYLRR